MSDSNWGYAWGIKIINSSNIIVSNCQFTAQRRGIYLLNCTGCVINGNVFKSRNGQPAYMIIYAQNTTLCSIVNNILDGYSDYGIYLDTGANNNIITGNVIVAANITTELTSLGSGCVTTPNIIA
jgi:parallel beta-helix repeat protein